MLIFGLLISLLSVVHFYRSVQAAGSDDPQKRGQAGWWVVAGVLTILTGMNIIGHTESAPVYNAATYPSALSGYTSTILDPRTGKTTTRYLTNAEVHGNQSSP